MTCAPDCLIAAADLCDAGMSAADCEHTHEACQASSRDSVSLSIQRSVWWPGSRSGSSLPWWCPPPPQGLPDTPSSALSHLLVPPAPAGWWRSALMDKPTNRAQSSELRASLNAAVESVWKWIVTSSQENLPLAHVLNRHLISIFWSGTCREQQLSGYHGNVTTQCWLSEQVWPHQLCELATNAPIQQLELPTATTIHHRHRAGKHLHKLQIQRVTCSTAVQLQYYSTIIHYYSTTPLSM